MNFNLKLSRFKYVIAFIVFVLTLGLYVHTMFPTVAPYRDAGEMCTATVKLGIMHPPGYPLYTIIGKIITSAVMIGNFAYRMNLFSAVCSAGTAVLLFLTLLLFTEKFLSTGILEKYGNIVVFSTFLTALLSATSYLQWYLSLVPEMYTLNTLFAAGVVYILTRLCFIQRSTKLWILFFLIAGLGLGNRLDLVLYAPGFAVMFIYYYWIYPKENGVTIGEGRIFSKIGVYLLAGITGAGVYLYLLLRSGTLPLFDWNHPATIEQLISTVTRKTHGGTLDLLSVRYAAGENFGAGLNFFFNYVLYNYTITGCVLAILGLAYLWIKNKWYLTATLAWFIISGPVFIYLSNMPPNTHALAILEAHFLLPSLTIVLWCGLGVLACIEFIDGNSGGTIGFCVRKAVAYGFTLILLFAVSVNTVMHYRVLDKRSYYSVWDYAGNVLRSCGPNTVVVAKEDVQVFALWYRGLACGKSLGTKIVAQGLAGSWWYQEQMKRLYPDLFVTNTKEPVQVEEFYQKNKDGYGYRVFFTVETDPVDETSLVFRFIPNGIVGQCIEKTAKEAGNNTVRRGVIMDTEFMVYRQRMFYDAYHEFFTPDLIEDYARGYFGIAKYFMDIKELTLAEKYFKKAINLNPSYPLNYSSLAYVYMEQNRVSDAVKYYGLAAGSAAGLLKKAEQYNSYPEVKEGIRKDIADAYNNCGVLLESRLNRSEDALIQYAYALKYHPTGTNALYNQAVVYWKRGDWQSVVSTLEQMLRVSPNEPRALKFLPMARYNLQKSKA
ncbi:MAG: DUF2723 domain-containing protein [Elusimicrobiota bacterium]